VTGDRDAAEALLGVLYDELRDLARARLRRIPPGQTLQPTALVHEAYLRLVEGGATSFEGRKHFFFAAARAMRDIVVERSRHKASLKRGGGRPHTAHEPPAIELNVDPVRVLEIDEALARFEALDPEAAQVVTLRFFTGMTNEQAADVIGVSVSTIERRWRVARAWLGREIGEEPDSPG